MNILHAIETSGPGGAENFLIRTAQALRPEYNSTVLLLKSGWLQQRLTDLGFPVIVEPLHRSFDPRWLYRVLKLLKGRKIDVIHSHEFAMNTHLAPLAKIAGIRHVATVHGKKYYGESKARRVSYRMVARLSGLVAVSEDIKSYLVDEVGIPADRVTVIANGICVEDYARDNIDVSAVRAQLGCDAGNFLVCAIGNLYPVKGHCHLIRAIARLVDQHPGIRLVIAGRGHEQAALEQLIAELGVEQNVTLLGFRDDVKSILLASDLFTMPSLSEGLPLSLLEAMAAKRPVVVSDVGGMPQVIKHEVMGLVVPPADDEALARAIDAIICGGLSDKYVQAAFAELVDNYSMDTMVQSYKKMYGAVVKSLHK
jgi:glycosyltransferase involved in cell wall biosynthesis